MQAITIDTNDKFIDHRRRFIVEGQTNGYVGKPGTGLITPSRMIASSRRKSGVQTIFNRVRHESKHINNIAFP